MRSENWPYVDLFRIASSSEGDEIAMFQPSNHYPTGSQEDR